LGDDEIAAICAHPNSWDNGEPGDKAIAADSLISDPSDLVVISKLGVITPGGNSSYLLSPVAVLFE
jgi:hypothetical protein